MIVNKWVLYWIDILSILDMVLLFSVIALLIGIVGSTFAYYQAYGDKEEKKILKLRNKLMISTLIVMLSTILIPSKDTMYQMLVAENITVDNIQTITEAIKDSTDYVIDKIKEEK